MTPDPYKPCPCGSEKKYRFCCHVDWTWTSRDGAKTMVFRPGRTCVGDAIDDHALVALDDERLESTDQPPEEFLVAEFPEAAGVLGDAIRDVARGDPFFLEDIRFCVKCRRVFAREDVEVCGRCHAPIVDCACGSDWSTDEERWKPYRKDDYTLSGD